MIGPRQQAHDGSLDLPRGGELFLIGSVFAPHVRHAAGRREGQDFMRGLSRELAAKAHGQGPGDLVEERLFARRRDLFAEPSVVFLDTISLRFAGAAGETLGAVAASPCTAHWQIECGQSRQNPAAPRG